MEKKMGLGKLLTIALFFGLATFMLPIQAIGTNGSGSIGEPGNGDPTGSAPTVTFIAVYEDSTNNGDLSKAGLSNEGEIKEPPANKIIGYIIQSEDVDGDLSSDFNIVIVTDQTKRVKIAINKVPNVTYTTSGSKNELYLPVDLGKYPNVSYTAYDEAGNQTTGTFK